MGVKKYSTARGETRYAVNVFNKHTGKSEWVGTFRNKEDAKDAMTARQNEIRTGEWRIEHKDIAFAALLDEWLDVQTVNLRPNTKADYTYTSRHFREYFKNRPTSGITEGDIYRFVAWVSKKGLSAHYVRKMAVRLSQIFKFARKMGYATQDPMKEKPGNLPEQPDKKVDPLTPEELRRLVDATPDQFKTVMLVMITCGLRRSEAFGITRKNVDLERGVIRITHQLVAGELVEPKTKRSKRVIPLTPSAAKALREHLAALPSTPMDLVFMSERGTPVDYMNFRKRIWLPTVERAGVRKNLTLHDLRRTFASALARHGRSPGYLQDVMGHQQFSTTMTYYVGLYDEERSAAVSDLEDWLSKEERQPQTVAALAS